MNFYEKNNSFSRVKQKNAFRITLATQCLKSKLEIYFVLVVVRESGMCSFVLRVINHCL